MADIISLLRSSRSGTCVCRAGRVRRRRGELRGVLRALLRGLRRCGQDAKQGGLWAHHALLVLLAALLGKLLVLSARYVLHEGHNAAQPVRDLLGQEHVGVAQRVDQRVEACGEQWCANVELRTTTGATAPWGQMGHAGGAGEGGWATQGRAGT